MSPAFHLCVLFALALLAGCGAARGPAVQRAQAEAFACEGELSDVVLRWPIASTLPVAGVVSAVEIVGARSVPEALVREAIHVPLGELVDMDVVSGDIGRIFEFEIFEDVRVVAAGEGDGQIGRAHV